MKLRLYTHKLKNRISNWIIFILFKLRVQNRQNMKFECPICGYKGPFMNLACSTGLIKHSICPNCHSFERHRFQFLVLNRILSQIDTDSMKILHFAPEPFFRQYLSKQFGKYESADFNMKDVDHSVDLQQLPFNDQSYDFVFASHVLEHIPDDEKALSEIRRILKPNGIAILPVPIVAEKTVEYPEPNPYEINHVRAPGIDYYEKYERYFSRVEKFSSDSLPEKYQLFIYENRSQWPTKNCPLRPSMPGEKHIDVIPVCYA